MKIAAPTHAVTDVKSPLKNKPGFRPELHGIRGLALGLVVVFHLFANGKVSGGIDIFLAITGFLFTGSLLRRVTANNGRLDFARHFSRIGYRLLPAALLVISATAVGIYLFLPRTRWLQAANEARASALYHENWELIWSQLSYEAGGPASSPFQHFWSLSVQGQFHLLWPLVIIATVFVARKFSWNAEKLTLAAVSAIFLISFIYANYMTATDQEVGYFHTATRMWELALGGLAGLLLPKIRLSHRLRILAGWLGFFLIVSCGIFLDGGLTFPGYQALWPISGLILMLLAGHTKSIWGADRLLMTRPFTFVADISYSLYLWHWPILVFYLVATERNRASIKGIFFVLAISVFLAALTKKFVEDPINRGLITARTYRKPLIAIGTTIAVFGTAGFATSNYLVTKQEESLALTHIESSAHPGAAAMLANIDEQNPITDADPIPDEVAIASDLPVIYSMGCTQSWREEPGTDEVKICRAGNPDASVRVLITGGSKAAQWHPAFDELASAWNWEVVALEKGGCQLSSSKGPDEDPVQSENCELWNESALELIPQLDVDLVITIASTSRAGEERIPDGFVGAWSSLAEHDIPILAIRDTPRFPYDVGECLVTNNFQGEACDQERNELLTIDFEEELARHEPPENVVSADLSDLFCNETTCETVIGNVAVYRDIHHVTATYMRTLAPFLEVRLAEQVPWLFE